jgi:hypothetical protein
MPTLIVGTDGLNLRSTPAIQEGNVVAQLTLAQPVEILESAPGDAFQKVRATVDGQAREGFASRKYLRQPLSDPREAIIRAAVDEWVRFGRGRGLEFVEPFSSRVHDYWVPLGEEFTGMVRGQPWSAAFISFIARQAGYAGRFPFATNHAAYINDAIAKQKAGDGRSAYWGFRLNEHKPQLGDLIAGWREHQRVTFDHRPEFFPSHCDLVVEVTPTSVRTLGGNVSQSVNMKTFVLDGNGFIPAQDPLFAILRNNL